METIAILIAVVAGLVLAYNLLVLPAHMAEEKGSSWWGFFLLSLIAYPIAFIWAWLILEGKSEAETKE